jgi:glycosyltransferase involved in cell wall biosynthesis
VRTGGAEAKRLLVHAYHFPPIGGSGAQRPLKLVRALTELGYDAVVVTSAGASADRWAPEDRTLALEIPSEVDVHHVSGTSELESDTILRHLRSRWLGAQSRWGAHWIEESCRIGRDVAGDVDLIYVWMQPYVSAEAGMKLARQLDKPWVADLGDPWALDEMMVYPTAFHRRADLRRMGQLLSTASAIVMSTPEAVSRLLAEFPELADRPVVAIPNGFDPGDFEGDVEPRQDGKFRIVHTGYLHTELGLRHRRHRTLRRLLRGSVPGLDVLTRSHVFLIEAIGKAIAQDPSLRDVLELHLAGVMNDTDHEVAGLCSVVTLHGYVSHAESIALMRTADFLFLPMQNLPVGTRATIVPGKTYEYIASGTPILAAVPEGDARDILAETGNAVLVRPDDVDAMSAAILTEVARARADVERDRGTAVAARFRYGELARELAGVFDTVLDRQPSHALART